MFENNWKTWGLLMVAFVGGCFEVFKHMPVRNGVTWEEENLHYGADGKPYSVHVAPNSYSAQQPVKAVHVAGENKVLQDEMKKFAAATKPTQTEAEHMAAGKKADDKKKKKKKKKKDKDAKKDEKSAEPVMPAQLAPPAQEDNSAKAIAAAVDAAAATGNLPPPKPKASEPFASLQEWERLLLKHPDLAETKRFIQEYKNHTVSTDIFYQITRMMIADSRPEMKDLGVLCAGSTFSVTSFQILAGVAKSSKSSSELQSRANQFLSQYTQPANLGILQNVLRSGDINSETIAVGLIDTAVTKQQPSTTPTAQGTGTTATSFIPFVALLQPLTQSRDAGLASQAQHTLQDLKNFLGGSGISNIAGTNTP